MNFKQSFAWWSFSNRGVEAPQLLKEAAKIGYQGVDLIDETLWPLAKDEGLQISAIAGHGTLTDGFNRKENAARIEAELLASIDKASKWAIPVLICFSGNRAGIDDKTALENSVALLSKVAPAAKQASVTLSLELLNSRDHLDYQADNTAWGVQLCEAINSPAVALLYDVYHMQVMEGDLIRTIRKHHSHFAHYHTAGNPGRHLMDDNQEIYYPAIYRAISETGYSGFIAHEFIPTGDPIAELKEAFLQCEKSVN